MRGGGKEHRCSSILLPCREKVTHPVIPLPHLLPALLPTRGSHPCGGESPAMWEYSRGRVPAGLVTQDSAGRAGGYVREMCAPGTGGRGGLHARVCEWGVEATASTKMCFERERRGTERERRRRRRGEVETEKVREAEKQEGAEERVWRVN